jgi:arylesterase/paraoxonase
MKIGRPRRPGRALLALVTVAILSAGGRAIWSNGVFSSAKMGFSGICKVTANLPGVQDMELGNGLVFLSVGNARGPGAADGVYAMAPDGGKPFKLAGGPKDFHPRGIGLYSTPDGKSLFLFAVNKRASGRFSIDSFEVRFPNILMTLPPPGSAVPTLVAQGTIEGGQLINPQDVAAVSPGTFYVANGTASKFAPMHILQTYGVLSGGNVLYFNGTVFREVADGLYGTRSMVLAGHGNKLVVGGLLSRSLTSFNREPFAGTLTEDKVIVLPTGPEKLSVDSNDQVWAAGHANILDWKAMTADPNKRASSQVFRVRLDGEENQQIYGNDGAQIAGASVALPIGRNLLIGSSLDGRLLLCSQ